MSATRGLLLAASTLVGCNWVLGMEEPSKRDGAGGAGGDGGSGAGLVGGQGGDGAATVTGGGGSGTGGSETGGQGMGGCAPEHATSGTELLDNGSFELGSFNWDATSASSFQTNQPGICGCKAARVVAPAGYSELRHLGLAPSQVGMVDAYARVKAPDSEYLELIVRLDIVNLTPLTFATDASDGAVDGWRTAEGTLPIGVADKDLYVAVAFEPDVEATFDVDCVSLSFTP